MEEKEMKKIFIYASIAILFTVSCQKNVIDGPQNEEPEYVTFKCVIDPGTKVDVSNAGKVTWVAGDKIHIHTGHNRSGEATVVTLTDEDITDEGRTAIITFEALTPYDFSSWGTGYATYYAAYPADATANPTSCYCRNYFSQTNNILMAACDNEGTFNFYNLCGLISFTVDGDYDSYVFAGNNEETVGYGTYAVEILAGSQNFSYVSSSDPTNGTKDPKTSISGAIETGETTYICVPNGVNLTDGFTIKLCKNGEIQKYVSGSSPLNLSRNKLVPLGNISAKLKDYVASSHESAIPVAGAIDLGASETANCYIIDNYASAGSKVYKFKAVKGNSGAKLGTLAEEDGAVVLWETYNNANTVTKGSVILAADYQYDADADCDYIYIQMPETPVPGNALIAAKNSAGTILWSWHIWVPQTTIATNTYGLYSSALMDRYLGALVAATTESVPVESYGLTYQWGRKDPFPGAKRVTSGSNAVVSGTSTSVATGTLTLNESIANPTVLGFADGDNWMNESDNTLWNDDAKTIYDPCPPGYRVPARVKTQPLHSSDLSTVTGWSDNSAAYYFAMGDPLTVFPYSGYRDDSNPAGMANAGSRVAIWTAYASSSKRAYHMNVRGGDTHALGETAKSRGGVIRCVVK